MPRRVARQADIFLGVVVDSKTIGIPRERLEFSPKKKNFRSFHLTFTIDSMTYCRNLKPYKDSAPKDGSYMRVHCPPSSPLFVFHEHVLGGAVRRDEHRQENVREDDRDEEAWRRAIGVASVRLSGAGRRRAHRKRF
mgnify:CR=1 FL=1